MRSSLSSTSLLSLSLLTNLLLGTLVATSIFTSATPVNEAQAKLSSPPPIDLPNISTKLFFELEELSRLVDIAYCVGNTGVWKPFQCASRCGDFEEGRLGLVGTWNTGPLLSDSCGYVVVDHGKKEEGRGGEEGGKGRIVVAFRGTYSLSNTIVDLTTMPQEYVPYPGDPDNLTDPLTNSLLNDQILKQTRQSADPGKRPPKCENCTVHSGFLQSWINTRPIVLKHILKAHIDYPSYSLQLVGHSLGGAVAALAGLELEIKGFNPTITTFGEPRIGNAALRDYLDEVFELGGDDGGLEGKRFRRVTHRSDPVPLLPLTEWGYKMHAGEHYIAKKSLGPEVSDIYLCQGDEDTRCIAGAEPGLNQQSLGLLDDEGTRKALAEIAALGMSQAQENAFASTGVGYAAMGWGQERMKLWELFFAHRDYFWRLGLCVPGGDPRDWFRRPYYEMRKGDEGQRPVEEL